MKIDEKILSLPPFLSTSWKNVKALHMKGNMLVITLLDGDAVSIPNLPNDIIDKIFICHANFLEHDHQDSPNALRKNISSGLNLSQGFPEGGPEGSLRFAFGNFEPLGMGLQHNLAQAHMPDLPPELINKVSSIAKIMVPNQDLSAIPKAEPHCNCPYCQIARAIYKGFEEREDQALSITIDEEEEVSEEDLHFQEWDIKQIGEQLFSVSNRLDSLEKYNVFLGEPVGCTCGKQGCEHIVAVLKS